MYIEDHATSILYCLYCSTISKFDQPILCNVRGDPDISDVVIARPFFCRDLKCKNHEGVQTIFCNKHPFFKNAVILEYEKHLFEEPDIEHCAYCEKDTSIKSYAPYCNQKYKIENLSRYLNKFPLVSVNRELTSKNLSRDAQIVKINVSVFSVHRT